MVVAGVRPPVKRVVRKNKGEYEMNRRNANTIGCCARERPETLKAFFEEMLRNIRHQIRLLLQQLACDLFVCEAQHQ